MVGSITRSDESCGSPIQNEILARGHDDDVHALTTDIKIWSLSNPARQMLNPEQIGGQQGSMAAPRPRSWTRWASRQSFETHAGSSVGVAISAHEPGKFSAPIWNFRHGKLSFAEKWKVAHSL
jgi:hypothetical protein